MKRIAAGILALAALLFGFQNCGKAGFENSELASDQASSLDVKLSKLPFPYQVSVNQIAHMTCPLKSTSPNSPYFSWKVGAYDNPSDVLSSSLNIRTSGLQLGSDFITSWNQISSTYTPTMQSAKLKEALTSLPSVANTQLQLSLRNINTPRMDLMALPTGGDSPTSTFMPVISSDPVTSAFVATPGDVLNVFPNASDYASRFLEASLSVPSADGLQDVALRSNYDASFLAIGFFKTDSASKTGSELSGPSDDTRYAYGKGFRVHFGRANPQTQTTNYPAADSLAVVEEYDLASGTRTLDASWDCSYRFKIVRPNERFNPVYKYNHFSMIGNECPTPAVNSLYCPSRVNAQFGITTSGACEPGVTAVQGVHCEEQYYAACPPEPYTANTSAPEAVLRDEGVYHPAHPERPAVLHALRRFLPANQWDINVSRKCVVPKADDGACYSGKVVYDDFFFSDATANANYGRYNGCGVNGQYPCAAYLTLCIRR